MEAIPSLSQHAAPSASLPPQIPELTPEGIKALIETSLDDDQAEDIVVIDLAGKTTIADYMVVATGRSTRHVGAMAHKLVEKLERAGLRRIEIEGLAQCDWVLIDAGDVIIHLFRPEVRTFYNLEKMWGIEQPKLERSVSLSA